MKKYYKISEISQLYDIGTDSLRYYERIGILSPRRGENGYRLYSLKDMYRLNLIRDLRKLGFTMAQIKDYLDDQSLAKTQNILRQEQVFLDTEILHLCRRRAALQERVRLLQDSDAEVSGVLRLLSLPRQICVQLDEHITRDEEMDFLIQKLQRRHEDTVKDLGMLSIGAFFDSSALARGLTNVYDSVFFLLKEDTEDYDFALQKGFYLSCPYRGSYEQNGALVRKMTETCSRLGFQICGNPFELYRIDNRFTVRPEEFLTEILLHVEPPQNADISALLSAENLW